MSRWTQVQQLFIVQIKSWFGIIGASSFTLTRQENSRTTLAFAAQLNVCNGAQGGQQSEQTGGGRCSPVFGAMLMVAQADSALVGRLCPVSHFLSCPAVSKMKLLHECAMQVPCHLWGRLCCHLFF